MPDHSESDKQQTGRNGGEHKAPALEWIASALGLILVTGSIGLILYDALDQDTLPQLNAEAGSVSAVGGRYLIEITVRNHGGSTAASVNVEGALKRGGKTLETASATFDYVPAHSQTTGGMLFSHDPRQYRLELDATAYMDP